MKPESEISWINTGETERQTHTLKEHLKQSPEKRSRLEIQTFWSVLATHHSQLLQEHWPHDLHPSDSTYFYRENSSSLVRQQNSKPQILISVKFGKNDICSLQSLCLFFMMLLQIFASSSFTFLEFYLTFSLWVLVFHVCYLSMVTRSRPILQLEKKYYVSFQILEIGVISLTKISFLIS